MPMRCSSCNYSYYSRNIPLREGKANGHAVGMKEHSSPNKPSIIFMFHCTWMPMAPIYNGGRSPMFICMCRRDTFAICSALNSKVVFWGIITDEERSTENYSLWTLHIMSCSFREVVRHWFMKPKSRALCESDLFWMLEACQDLMSRR